MKSNKKLFTLALITVVFLCGMFFLRDFNLKWVQVHDDRAIVTINFLFPMNQDKFESSITLGDTLPQAGNFSCNIEWKSDTTVQLIIKELSDIKGQKILLQVTDAPTQIAGLSKNADIPIQFKSEVSLIAPTEELLISTQDTFPVRFNTPMDKKILYKYLQSDTKFYINEVKIPLTNGKEVVDSTSFTFTPKQPLENGRKYILSFRKGMPSQAGVLLAEDVNMILNTDIKPEIISVYPDNGDNWIGLYPRISLQTNKPVAGATLYLNGESIEGKMINDYKAEFLLSEVLKPSTKYTMSFEVTAPTGERSLPKEVSFTTVPIKEDRIWIEIILDKNQKIIAYKGNNPIKTIVCSGGSAKHPTKLGTYYITEKNEKYFDDEKNEGANALLTLSEGLKIHGITRDEYWKPKANIAYHLGAAQTKGDIILSDEDAVWLYNYLPVDTMVVIHE